MSSELSSSLRNFLVSNGLNSLISNFSNSNVRLELEDLKFINLGSAQELNELCKELNIISYSTKLKLRNAISKLSNDESNTTVKKEKEKSVTKNKNTTVKHEKKTTKKPYKGFQIFIRNLEGKTLVLNHIKHTDTVLSIKNRILDKEGIPVKEQRLIYGGKQLKDEKMISFYEIKKESTLHLVLRLLGGL